MRFTLVVLLFALAFTLIFSCSSEPKEPPHRYEVCQCKDTSTVKDNVAHFPFNPEITVVVYEYKSEGDSWINLTSADEIGLDTGGVFDPADISRVDTLSEDEKKQLEKVVFNRYEVCTNEYSEYPTDCGYLPHHCAVFYKEDKVVAYLEICFICEKTKTWPKETFGTMCGDFDCEVRYFLRQVGFADNMLALDHCPGYVPDTTEIWKGGFEK